MNDPFTALAVARSPKPRRVARPPRAEPLPALRTPWALSPTQVAVLRHASAGLSYTAIGAALNISHKTVCEHMTRARDKMGLVSRDDAMKLWAQFDAGRP